jgi:hypothetical protein
MKNPGPPVAKTNRQDQNVVKNPGPPVAKTTILIKFGTWL